MKRACTEQGDTDVESDKENIDVQDHVIKDKDCVENVVK